jgi:hypothetical protein
VGIYVAWLRHCPAIFLEGVRRTGEYEWRGSVWCARGSTCGSPAYEPWTKPIGDESHLLNPRFGEVRPTTYTRWVSTEGHSDCLAGRIAKFARCASYTAQSRFSLLCKHGSHSGNCARHVFIADVLQSKFPTEMLRNMWLTGANIRSQLRHVAAFWCRFDMPSSRQRASDFFERKRDTESGPKLMRMNCSTWTFRRFHPPCVALGFSVVLFL